jgi:hypothetical protein
MGTQFSRDKQSRILCADALWTWREYVEIGASELLTFC